MEWKDCFKPWVLERGFDYFTKGSVRNLETGSGYCSAVVHGSHPYDVRIEFDDDGLSDMSCSCSQALKGNSCKHMAAVLYALEAEEGRCEVNDVIDSLPETVLRSLVKEYCLRDSSFLDFLISGGEREDVHCGLKNAEQKENPVEEFERLLARLDGGSIDLFLEELRKMEENASGEIGSVFLLRLSDWMEANQDLSYIREVEEGAFKIFFESGKYTERLLEYVDGRLLSNPEGKEELYVRQKLMLLRKLGIESRFVSPFRAEHLDLPDVRHEEVLYLLSAGDVDNAVKLLKDGKAGLSPENRYYAVFTVMLIEVYSFLPGMEDEEASELYDYLSRIGRKEVFVRRYQKLSSEVSTEG